MARSRLRKQQQRAAKEAIITQKECEDDQGIKRKVKYGYNDGLSLNTIRITKIILLVGGVLSYFLYSVLLFPIVLVYGLLYFSVRQKERNLNYGLRKELWVKLPKFDSLIAIIIIVCTVSMVGLSAMSSGNRTSVFAGKNELQVYQMLKSQSSSGTDEELRERATEMVKNGMTLTTWEKYMYQAGTLLTGQRELFQSKYQAATSSFGGRAVFRSGSRPSVGPPGGGTMKIKRPDGSSQTFSGGPPGGFPRGRSMGMNPMMMAQITQILTTVNIILLVLTMSGGAFIAISKKGREEEQIKKKDAPVKIALPTYEGETMRIKTIKPYTDAITGEKSEVGDIRTVTRDRAEKIIGARYAIEFVSKSDQKIEQNRANNANRNKYRKG